MSPIDKADLDSLKPRLRGQLLLPGEPGYDDSRSVWNAMIDKRPAAIVRCLGVADVVTGVNFAREHAIPLSIKGGGHNISGLAVCDDGLAYLTRKYGWTCDGALADLPDDYSAVGNRDAGVLLNLTAAWEKREDDGVNIEWARSIWRDMRRFSTGGTYINFLTEEEGGDRIQAAYGENLERSGTVDEIRCGLSFEPRRLPAPLCEQCCDTSALY